MDLTSPKLRGRTDPSAARMQRRRVGRTEVELSVIGFGTAQLQMVPERQAIDTLVRGFELGVNWVHTAPDYGGIDPYIAAAVRRAPGPVHVLTAGPPRTADMEAFFENACHVYGTQRLALYGISGIEDIEWHGENVWGAGGMVEYLQHKKAEGRLGGIYCSTHGSAETALRLIKTGVFDAIMLAWNPLGFHQQSQFSARAKIGRDYEEIAEFPTRVFPAAAEHGVSVLVMKPFAGGLLCRSRAFPPHDWYADPGEPVAAADVLRLALQQPGVCAVLPGTASVAEAEENARAGHEPDLLPAPALEQIVRTTAGMRTRLCSRCGKCEVTCSHSLPIPTLFRDAYIWTSRNETVMANATENYFDRHPNPALLCLECLEQSCLCEQGLVIPQALGRVHDRLSQLRKVLLHPGSTADMAARAIDGEYPTLVLTADVPVRVPAGTNVVARFLLQNRSTERWLADQHTTRPDEVVGVSVWIDDALTSVVGLRNTLCPGDASSLAFEFPITASPGAHVLRFRLCRRFGDPTAGTEFHCMSIDIEAAPSPTPPKYGVRYLEHSFPQHLHAGVTYGIWLHLVNSGAWTWPAHPADGHPVQVDVLVDGIRLITLPLSQGDVPPGGALHLHFPFRAHDIPGRHAVRIELLHAGLGGFAEHGVEPWQIELDIVAAPPSRSVALFEISRKHNPWHYNPLMGIAQSRDGHPFPLFISGAKGCLAWDAEGNEYIDYTMGWGSTLLGHAEPRVQAAIRGRLDSGAVLPFPHEVEMDVTRMLLEDFPGNDMVVFGKNGSDVCTIASRLARVITGKRVILSCGFHGWQDFALDYFSFADSGIPDRPGRVLHKFGFNDAAGFQALFDRCRHDLAAVMIEPAGPFCGDEVGLGGEADPEFLRMIADAARSVGALVIFDEIITGFRYRAGNVQRATGVRADLTCVGKALANGMPLAALIGPYRNFLAHFHKTHFCPTFKSEIYSLAAAKVAIEIYRREPVIEHVWSYGEALRTGIHGHCQRLGIDGFCSGPPFRMAFVFRERDAFQRQLKRTLLMQELLKRRIITVTGMMLPSYAHGTAVLTRTIEAFGGALAVVAEAERTGQMHRKIELSLL